MRNVAIIRDHVPAASRKISTEAIPGLRNMAPAILLARERNCRELSSISPRRHSRAARVSASGNTAGTQASINTCGSRNAARPRLTETKTQVAVCLGPRRSSRALSARARGRGASREFSLWQFEWSTVIILHGSFHGTLLALLLTGEMHERLRARMHNPKFCLGYD